MGGATIIGSSTAGPSTGPAERCSPSTSVVTPCAVLLRARGSTTSPYSEWACMSMNPGASTIPPASISWRASGSSGPTLTMVSPATARFPRNHGPPVPSTMRAPRISRSAGAGASVGGGPHPARTNAVSTAAVCGMRLICLPPGFRRAGQANSQWAEGRKRLGTPTSGRHSGPQARGRRTAVRLGWHSSGTSSLPSCTEGENHPAGRSPVRTRHLRC